MNKVIIYTDGACSGNPGPGGWGCVLIYNGIEKRISGGANETTNNEMEMTAVYEALSLLKFPCEVDLYSDSAYVVNAISKGWLENWKKNNWQRKDVFTKEIVPIKNQELWEKIDNLLQIHNVTFYKVKGHSDNKYNNICDKLARDAINHDVQSQDECQDESKDKK